MQQQMKLQIEKVPVELQLSLGAPIACTEGSKRNGEKNRGKV